MGMTEEFETSLQVLRGFDTDISVEVSEIKVIRIHQSDCTELSLHFLMSNIFISV